MGIATRKIANSFTTSGVIVPDAVTNTSIGSITALPSGVVGNLVLVSSATASSSATIDFTLGDYKEYQFYFVNIHPQNNDPRFEFNLSTDNGSNYNVTKTTTVFRALNHETSGVSVLDYSGGNDLAQSTSFQDLNAGGIKNDNDIGLSGTLTLFNPSSNVYVKHFIATTNIHTSDGYSLESFVAGYGNITSPINSLRFQMDSGNIDSGTILMYGVV